MKLLKDKRLSTKLSVIVAGLLIVIFSILISVTAMMIKNAMEQSISSELTATARSTGNEVQAVLDSATLVAEDMQAFLSRVYQNSQAINEAGADNTYESEIYHSEVKAVPYTMELYLLNSARNAVINNDDITAVGTMFEPKMFAANIEDYAFSVDSSNATGDISPFGSYSTYCNENYYTISKLNMANSITEPFLYEGTLMVTLSSPILFNNRFMGAVTVDIDVSNFDRIKLDTSRYSTLYGMVIDDDFKVVYDSRGTENVGKSLADLVGSENVDKIDAKAVNGQDFSQTVVRPDGTSAIGFYVPINASGERWWSLTSLDTKEVNSIVNQTALILTILSIFALVLLVVITTVVLRRMLKPINTVVSAAESIAAGDLNIHLEAKSQDEIGLLTQAFDKTISTLRAVIQDITHVLNAMANKDLTVETATTYVGDLAQIKESMDNIGTNLNFVMHDINLSANQVSSGSDQVSSGAQALSQGTTEQAASVEELAATIGEISKQVEETAEHAKMARETVGKVGDEAQVSNQRMQEMLSAMDEISDKSTEISKIIKTIEDIAFQTNILALNAAVEAARAGEAGKGFAVVADEVRNLANKSQEASKGTAALIESTVQAVSNGRRIADETAQALASVVQGVGETTETIGHISSAADNQAASISQVTQGVDQVSSVVQTNSATAEESAAASEELSAQAQGLRELVAGFRLRQNETN